MRLGVIADDFTGASDVANTLAKGGVATALAFGKCPDAVPDAFDGCVVALKSRSIAVAGAVAQSLAALDGLARLGARRFIFKYCSTFNSTPAGNIGPVSEALAERLGVSGAVVSCPAFPDAGRTVYQGHLFVFDRLLSQSGMENHPLNPMTDPDIRRWLALQSRPVGHLPLSTVRAGGDAIRARLAAEVKAGRGQVIADAVENVDLMALGEAIAGDILVAGGSGIAMGVAPFHAGAGARQRGEVRANRRPGDRPRRQLLQGDAGAGRALPRRPSGLAGRSGGTYSPDGSRPAGPSISSARTSPPHRSSIRPSSPERVRQRRSATAADGSPMLSRGCSATLPAKW